MTLPLITFLIGSEPFQKRLFLEDVKAELFQGKSGGLNDDSFSVNDKSLMEIFDLANTLPMMVRQRLILLQNFDTPNEKEQELWLRYIDNPSPSTVLLVLAEKLDKRIRLFKALDKKGMIKEFSEPKPRDLPLWLDRISKKHSVSLTPQAKEALVNSVGGTLSRLDQEVEKLALYIHPQTKISEEDVAQLVLQSSGENIFAWTDQVIEGKWANSLETLHHLLKTGTPPLVLVSMLARHLRILFRARTFLSERKEASSAGSFLGVPPFLVNQYLAQARKVSDPHLERSFSELVDLDRALKSTGHPPYLLLERASRNIAALGE